MKPSYTSKYIYNTWKNIPTPKNETKFETFQYLKTNLWILKNSKGSFGFLISNTISKLDSGYKNISADWKLKLTSNGAKIISKCLIIESKENIDSELFCSAISSLFEITDKKKIFKVDDIQEALQKIEDITIKESDEFNETVGVWGELNLLLQIITSSKNDECKYEIINSWEGAQNRSLIDFSFSSKKTHIEVKSSAKGFRIHQINGLNQVARNSGWNGYLASFCLIENVGGITCSDLVKKIRAKLNSECIALLEIKIKIRGRVCMNKKYKLMEDSNKKLEFFDFDNVPKPITEIGIGKIEWEAILEKGLHLNQIQKLKLLNLYK